MRSIRCLSLFSPIPDSFISSFFKYSPMGVGDWCQGRKKDEKRKRILLLLLNEKNTESYLLSELWSWRSYNYDGVGWEWGPCGDSTL